MINENGGGLVMPRITSFSILNSSQLNSSDQIQFQITVQKGTFNLKSIGTQIYVTDNWNGGSNVISGPYYSFDSSEATQDNLTVTLTSGVSNINPGFWSLWEIRIMDVNTNYLMYRDRQGWGQGIYEVYSTFGGAWCDTHTLFNSSPIFERLND